MTERVNYAHWTAIQSDLLPLVPPEAIPHGAIFPISTIQQFVHGGVMVELGAGRGASAETIETAGFAYIGIEINEGAVLDTRKRGYVSFPGDARNFWSTSLNLAAFAMIETANGVLLQGLIANIVETQDILSVILTADIFLQPGGYLLIAEPVLYDMAEWVDDKAEYAGYSMGQWRQRWLTRYSLNEETGLPRGVFAVAKPGPNKDALDWAQSLGAVQTLINSNHLERFARHVNEEDIIVYAREQHLTLKDRQHMLMFSRFGEPLPGVYMVFRKEYGLDTAGGELLYRYKPWYKDRIPNERLGFQDERHWNAHADENKYRQEFIEQLKQNFPPSMQPPKEYTI